MNQALLSKAMTQYHPSEFRSLRYVYPVVSRRAGGVSVGINLNPSCHCTFNCVYCQVHGVSRAKLEPLGKAVTIDLEVLENELRQVVTAVLDGGLFEDEWFSRTTPERRILKDIAFAGDGEPTISPQFPEAVDIAAGIRAELCPPEVKLVLITNATALLKPSVQKALLRLSMSNGEIWTKLDAGNEREYRRINRSSIPFSQVLSSIKETGRKNPIVIQSCFFLENGNPPDNTDILDYTDRLNEIRAAGATVDRVQVYTVARDASESNIEPLPDDRLDIIGETVRKATNLTVEVFYSR